MTEALAIFFLIGLTTGSVLSSITYRLPRGISLHRKRSFCPTCTSILSWIELIPLVSYLFQKGECRHCRRRISLRYPALEATMGAVCVGLYVHSGLTWESLTSFVFVIFMVMIAIVDWEHLIIPDSILVLGFLAGSFCFASTEVKDILPSIIDGLGAFTAVFAARAFGSWLFRKPAMGFGDVKLAGQIGFFIGFPDFLLVLWVASVAGSAYWLFCLLSGKELRTINIAPNCGSPSPDPIGSVVTAKGALLPFGTFLSISAIAVMFMHEVIRSWVGAWIALAQ